MAPKAASRAAKGAKGATTTKGGPACQPPAGRWVGVRLGVRRLRRL